MPKEWFILINSEKEGPYSLTDLKQDPRITPDILVWKKGMSKWTAIRDVFELNDLFQDKKPENEGKEEDENLADQPSSLGPYDMTLTIQGAPPHLFLWLIIAALIMLYVCYQLFTAR